MYTLVLRNIRKKQTLPDLCNSYLLESQPQAEFCANRNYHTWPTQYEHKGFQLKSQPQKQWNPMGHSIPWVCHRPAVLFCHLCLTALSFNAIENVTRLKKRSSILYSIFKFITSVNLEIVQAGKCLYSIHTQDSTLVQKTAHIIKTFSSWSCILKIDKKRTRRKIALRRYTQTFTMLTNLCFKIIHTLITDLYNGFTVCSGVARYSGTRGE